MFAAGIQNNHPVPTMAGRPVMMGYPGGSLDARAFRTASVRQTCGALYAFSDEPSDRIIDRYGLDYRGLGLNERETLGANVGLPSARRSRR